MTHDAARAIGEIIIVTDAAASRKANNNLTPSLTERHELNRR